MAPPLLLADTEAAPAAEVGQAVVDAWRAGTGWALIPDEAMLARPEMMLRLIPLVTEVARRALGAPDVVPVLSSVAERVSTLAWRLMHFAWQMRPDIAFPLDEVLAWVEMVAGDPGMRSGRLVADLGVEATETFE